MMCEGSSSGSSNCSTSTTMTREERRLVCHHIQRVAVQLLNSEDDANATWRNNTALFFDVINKQLAEERPLVTHNWFQYVIPMISILGIIGNLLNLLVLTRRRMLSNMDRLEKSATYGLVALALSDMLFCIVILPNAFIYQDYDMVEGTEVYILYYKIYGLGLVNLFVMISTWLIVTMSMNRYVVVVYPLHARSTLSALHTNAIIVLVFVLSLVMTLPYFLLNKITFCYNLSKEIRYEFQARFQDSPTSWLLWYIQWVWPIIADFIPFTILAFCNTRLIWELKKATNTRRQRAKGQTIKVTSNHKVTLTLVIIVLMLLFLVSPSEILRFINPYQSWGRAGHIAVSITNVLQAINFAFNFILYCAVNTNFRQTFKSMLYACSRRKEERMELQRMLTHGNTTEKTFFDETELK